MLAMNNTHRLRVLRYGGTSRIKNRNPPLGPPQDPRHRPAVGYQGLGVWGFGVGCWDLGIGCWDVRIGIGGCGCGVWSLVLGDSSLGVWAWRCGICPLSVRVVGK